MLHKIIVFRLVESTSDEEKVAALEEIGRLDVLASTFGSGTPGRDVLWQLNQMALSYLEKPSVLSLGTKVTCLRYFFN